MSASVSHGLVHLNDPLSGVHGEVLQRNLLALESLSKEAARRIAAASPRVDLTFRPTEEGALSADVRTDAGEVALASRRRPLQEAERLAAGVDLAASGVVVVGGFALGHHVRALALRLRRRGAIVVFEPDVPLLRAVLERVDISEWWREGYIVLLTDENDAGAMAAAMQGIEGVIAMGVALLDHPPSRGRLGGRAAKFLEHFTRVVEATKTAVVTSLVKSPEVVRNATQNLDHYAKGSGIADLAGAFAGRPAVVVSAGPSLQRNIDLLADPVARERWGGVIIAVQTVLKPLLERGIRPHFVTALDYSELSRRFYEGLTTEDVRGVTLVAEPMANPAILDAFPGIIRCTHDKVLDLLLGGEILERVVGDRGHGRLEPAATVAHLAYYLARHLGCDPVILIGQDLGFTDGQYYSAGAAIHSVWACETNPFNTLENLEWQRIARMGRGLREATDMLGRRVYTDEQMSAYLVQFERDFKRDADRGLTTIDATEGGVRKNFTTPSTLREAMVRVGGNDGAGPVAVAPPPAPSAGSARLVAERVRRIRRDVRRVEELSRKAGVCLSEMLEHQADQARVNRLIGRVDSLRREVTALEPAFSLVGHINQAGVFNRLRADRGLSLEEGLSPIERQKRQIERDIANVSWLAEAANELGCILDDADSALAGRGKKTRPPATAEMAAPQAGSVSLRVGAVIAADFSAPGWAGAPSLEAMLAGMPALARTLTRVAACEETDCLFVVSDDPDRARELCRGAVLPARAEVQFIRAEGPLLGTEGPSIRAARAWAGTCWRGGIGNLTCFDEVIHPGVLSRILHDEGLDAALVVGGAWGAIDAALCDEEVRRHRESPRRHRLTFSQAAPGLAGCVLSRAMAADMAKVREESRGPGTIGSALGYWPASPSADVIATPACVPVEPALRDRGVRVIPDSPARAAVLGRALATLPPGASAAEIVERLGVEVCPAHLLIELSTRRFLNAGGPAGGAGAVNGFDMPARLAERILDEAAEAWPGLPITFGLGPRGGFGDPMAHPALADLVARARERGLPVHVRTELNCPRARVDAMLSAAPDVISVDLHADTEESAEAIAGHAGWRFARENLEHMLLRRGDSPGVNPLLRSPWIVPRMVRRDSAYTDIETFYTRWMLRCGWAVLDPLPEPLPGERIGPLPLPSEVAQRRATADVVVRWNGRMPAPMVSGAWAGAPEAADVSDTALVDAVARRRAVFEGNAR